MGVVLMNPEKIKPLQKKIKKFLKKGYTLSKISDGAGVNKTTCHRLKEGVQIGEINADKIEQFFFGKTI